MATLNARAPYLSWTRLSLPVLPALRMMLRAIATRRQLAEMDDRMLKDVGISRVDALREAGGARAGVDLTTLNLARVLVDGEQILVGARPAPGVAASAASQPGAAGNALVSLNPATLEQLETLPGVGPVTAQKIVDWRTAHGAFTAIDELLEVDGIGEKTLADLAPHLTL